MRKLIAMLLALILLVGIAACGGSGGESSVPASSVAENSEPVDVETTTSTTETTTAKADETTTATEKPTTTEPIETTAASVKKTTASRALKKTTVHTEKTTEKTTTTTAAGEIPLPERKKYDVVGTSADPIGWVYTLPMSGGLRIREATFDSGKGGEPAEIVQITDIHFNKLNDKDFEENNPSVMSTYAYRTHMKNGASQRNAERCLNYGGYFDQIVVTGDTLDYLTWGAIEMVHDIIWKNHPDTLIALGNHEPVRVMGLTNDVPDPTSLESRYQILQDNWKHDIYYTSKVIKDKAMVIQMDNSQGHFWDSQAPKLKADIEKARKNGYVILVFVHVPLASNNPAETDVKEIDINPTASHNFYEKGVKDAVWEIIMNNADAIGGVFAGHIHENYYSEMLAKTPSGESKIIPQYVLAAAFSNTGHVLRITVK